jgi:aspartyl-tRNA synthetase
MAFSDGKQVMKRIERFVHFLLKSLHKKGSIVPPPQVPFPRMTYSDAMRNYGSDKPDLRIPDRVSTSC